MRYINQLDHPHMLYVTKTEMEGEAREKGRTTTIKSSGCGLCSAIMVADRLLVDYDFELYDAIQLAYDVEANHKDGTNYKRFAPAFAEKMLAVVLSVYTLPLVAFDVYVTPEETRPTLLIERSVRVVVASLS